jgi:hypothetical protein
MANAKTKTAKAEAKVAKVEVKEAKSKAQINFEQSVERIKTNRSTGNSTLDELGSKVLYGIFENRLNLVEQKDGSFIGQLGNANICVKKVDHGEKSTRIILSVESIDIHGEFAARAYKMAYAKAHRKGRASIQVDESKVNDVMSLLD